MNNRIIKDPSFPMRHAQVTELKNTAKVADLAKDADVLIALEYISNHAIATLFLYFQRDRPSLCRLD
ncbi:MAG: hypothetical protein HC769_29405 [Cyanobacteria bacterium CRU_2_1]|nr:hypothetical protein [Cyanobacteria bacterium CRU_2_1]